MTTSTLRFCLGTCAIAAALLSPACSDGGVDPAGTDTPSLTTLSPSSAEAGGPAFTLVLTGRDFAADAVVRWGGASRTTAFVSETELRAQISAPDIAFEGPVNVSVQNPGSDGGTSNAMSFTVVHPVAQPTPTLATLEPGLVGAGGAGFVLTARGAGFVSTSVVRWNGADRPTTFVDPGTVTATIAASDVVNPDTVSITVFTPLPGGGESSPLPFVVLPAGLTSLRTVSLPANDLLFEPTTGRLFASVGGSGGARANSLTQVDPATGAIGSSVGVGSEPTRMARSDDGQYLYVALRGAAAVRRYIVSSGTAELQFALGNDSFFGPMYADDIAVLPGLPHTVAISLMYPGVSPRHAGVRIYDDGVARATATPGHTGSNEIEAASATTLYGANTETTEFGIRTMLVSPTGVTITQTFGNLASGFGGAYVLAGGLLYTPGGTVVDPEAGQLVGTFLGGRGPLAVDLPNDRVFFLQTYGIAVYSASTFGYLGSIAVTTVDGNHLVRWGTNGLAFVAGGTVYLLTTSYLP